jgi:hypothetical protein
MCVCSVAPGDRIEIAAQRLHSVTLAFDFAGRTKPKPSKDRQGRTPALKRVLRKEGQNRCRQQQKPPIQPSTQYGPENNERRGVSLQHSLDVPLTIELGQARAKLHCLTTLQACEARIGLRSDQVVEFS